MLDNAELHKRWEELEDIPVDNNECLEADFYHFSKGTSQTEVWKWFDEQLPLGLGRWIDQGFCGGNMAGKVTLLYENAGDVYLGIHRLMPADMRIYKEEAKMRGHVGYLSGYRRKGNDTQSVVVFFKEQPSEQEIQRRRGNGFLAARWYWV